MKLSAIVAAVFLVSTGMTASSYAQDKKSSAKGGGGQMTFFVTSAGNGKGADLGGLKGADAHCNALAKAAGSKLTNWHAYLSTTEPGRRGRRERARPHRQGPVAQRQGRGGREERRRPAFEPRTRSTSRPRLPRRARR